MGPAVAGATLGSIGAVGSDGWYEVDVTARVTGNGTYSFGATSTSSDGAYYDSRESGADAPQLVITTGTTTPPALRRPGPGRRGRHRQLRLRRQCDRRPAGRHLRHGLHHRRQRLRQRHGRGVHQLVRATWGRHRARTRPSPGNHDYNTSGAAPYYSYFGAQAGPSGRGYYSYDLGNWHIVSLNSNIAMSAGSAQEQWLRADLTASTGATTTSTSGSGR